MIVDGRVVLSGAFVPGTSYRVVVGTSVAAKADDRPLAWSGEIAIPARTPGARLAAGVTSGAPVIEAVNLAELTVELPDGRSRQLLRLEAGRANLPAWLLHAGENRLILRWAGGSAEVVCQRQDLRFTPEEAAPVLSGGGLPVVSQR